MIAASEEQTKALGAAFAQKLKPGDVVALHGDLGAGKTTFVKGALRGLIQIDEDQVQSPTFIYLHIYEAKIPIYHFDLYRIEGESAFIEMGFPDFLGGSGICFIEWPNRIASLLPSSTIHLHLSHTEQGERSIDAS